MVVDILHATSGHPAGICQQTSTRHTFVSPTPATQCLFMQEGALVADYREHHSDSNVHFVVELLPGKMEELLASPGGLEAKFKLTTKIATSRCPMPVNIAVAACTVAPCTKRQRLYLRSHLPLGNMMLFNKDGLIKQYQNPEQIISEFYGLRLEYYEKRRIAMLRVGSKGLHLLWRCLPVRDLHSC